MSKEKDHFKPALKSCWKDNQNKKHARDNWRRIVEDLDFWEESSTHIVKDEIGSFWRSLRDEGPVLSIWDNKDGDG